MKSTLPPLFRPPLAPVCCPGDFPFAALGLDHGHINAQCQELIRAGGELRFVYDSDEAKIRAFQEKFPSVKAVAHPDEILDQAEIKLVTSSIIPNQRAALGLRVLESGKDFFVSKAPFTTLEQLETVRQAVARTGRKYAVHFSERLLSESALYAGELIASGAIGRVVHLIGLGPHRLNPPGRPSWFFNREQAGGILGDIGSHQVEQLLSFGQASEGQISWARVANVAHPEFPEFQDFGEFSLMTDTGVSAYFRVDWLTPSGLTTWGDGRTLIVGTEGTIELRKYVDIARESSSDHVYLVNEDGEHHFHVAGQIGFPFFGEFILDCLNRTEKAMAQAHCFKAAELSLKAQKKAESPHS